MSDFRDIQHGVNGPVGGADVKPPARQIETAHQREQTGADVRPEALPDPDEPFLPEALRRPATHPLNRRTGRRPSD